MTVLNKFYSRFLRKTKGLFRRKHQRIPPLQKHWLDVMLGKKKSLLPLPDEVVFGITIEEVQGLRKELDGIHRRLSTLECNGRHK